MTTGRLPGAGRRFGRPLAATLVVLQLAAGCAQAPTPEPATPTAPAATIAPPTATAVPTTTPGPRAATRLRLIPLSPAVARDGRAEFAIETDGVFANPFDPAEVDLQVRFTSPDGASVSVPAFFYQAYAPDTLEPMGEPGWRARFTPTFAGDWSAQAVLTQGAVESPALAFTVAADDTARGFVRVDPTNPRFFAFDNGEPYVPIGANIAWATSLDASLSDYTRWFDGLSANGGNVARLWMASWGFGIEWQDTGLGDYTRRLKQAWLLDQVFDLAAERDIYILLCLLNHGAFSASVNPEWDANPYNVANGGMLAEPADFVSDPQAGAFFQRRLRYIAARWGYSPNLFAWEWWNELSLTPISDDALKPWLKTMTAELIELDPNDHLMSSSYASGGYTRIWREPEIDFAQVHDYSGVDPVLALQRELEKTQRNTGANPKPSLVAEHGSSVYGADTTEGREDIHLHNGVWAPPFLGYAGTAFSWWWDTYLDPADRWGVYRPFAVFIAGERLGSFTPGRAVTDPAVVALTLQDETRALVWVRSQAYDAAATLLDKATPAPGTSPFELLTGVTLTLSGLTDGAYVAHWFSPQTGEWLATEPVSVAGGTVTLTAPDFSTDLALKLLAPDAPVSPGP